MKLQEAEQIRFLGLINAYKAPPTKEYRAAIWSGMLGTVYAMNDDGDVEYFDYNYQEAIKFAGADNPDAAPRVYKINRAAYGKPYGEYQNGPTHGKTALFVKKSQYRKNEVDINAVSEDAQIRMIHWNWYRIEDIIKPSVRVQLAAVAKNSYAIKLIKKPSEKVQLRAVTEHGYLLRDIINNGVKPSFAVQMAALEKYPYAISSIIDAKLPIDPRIKRFILQTIIEKIKLEDFEGAGELFDDLNNKVPWPEIKTIEKVLRDKNLLNENTEDSNLEAEDIATVKMHPLEIRNIKNPSEAVQMAAVQRSGEVIKHIANPTEAVKLAAVKESGYAIKYIENPSEQVQLEAIKNWPFVIADIDKSIVTSKVKRYIIITMLNTIKSGNIARFERLYNLLQQKGYDWPELDTLKRSIDSKSKLAENKNGRQVDLNSSSEQEQLAAVEKDVDNIRWIRNPSEAVQLSAVRRNVQIIHNLVGRGIVPSEAVQLQAATQWGQIIKQFKNPSYAVQLAAVKNDPLAIGYVPSGSITSEMKTTVLKHLMSLINHPKYINTWVITNVIDILKNKKNVNWPELDIIKKSLKNKKIINESDFWSQEENQIDEVESSPYGIHWLMLAGIKPSEKVKLSSVQRWPSSIKHIDNPSEAVQLAAVNNMPSVIEYINNPSEQVMLVSLKDNIMNLHYIKTQITSTVKRFILKKILELFNGKNYHYAIEVYNILKKKNIDWPELSTIEKTLNSQSLLEISDSDSEQTQIDMINKNWENILDIKNPSEAVQIAAVRQWPEGIKYIINKGIKPSVDVQLAALETEPVVAHYIKKDMFSHQDVRIKRLLLKRLLEYISEERGKGWYIGLNSVNLFKILKDKQVDWPELRTVQKYFDDNNLL